MSEEKRQVDCLVDCFIDATQSVSEGNLSYAALCLRDAANSLEEIEQIRKGEANAEQVSLNGHVMRSWNVLSE